MLQMGYPISLTMGSQHNSQGRLLCTAKGIRYFYNFLVTGLFPLAGSKLKEFTVLKQNIENCE